MSLFSEVSKARASVTSAKLNDMPLNESRDYVVCIGDTLYKKAGYGGMNFIIEFVVLKGTDARPPGTQASWVQQPETRSTTDAGNVKAYINACLGRDDPDAPQTEEEGDASLENKYKGTVLGVNVTHILTKGTKRDFFVHRWSPFRGDAKTLITALGEDSAPPAPPAELTEESWLAGAGPATVHPTSAGWEFHPDHKAWGCRKA